MFRRFGKISPRLTIISDYWCEKYLRIFPNSHSRLQEYSTSYSSAPIEWTFERLSNFFHLQIWRAIRSGNNVCAKSLTKRKKYYWWNRRVWRKISAIYYHLINMITVYTKDYCPYCVLAKNLLNNLGTEYQEIDVTNSPEILQEIMKKSHMRTVPQIFVDDNCLGGYSDINTLHKEWKLEELLGLKK